MKNHNLVVGDGGRQVGDGERAVAPRFELAVGVLGQPNEGRDRPRLHHPHLTKAAEKSDFTLVSWGFSGMF